MTRHLFVPTLVGILAVLSVLSTTTTIGQAPAAIFEAVKTGDVSRVSSMLAADSQLVNSRGADGRTPLFEAVDAGNPAMARLLIQHGADVNARESSSDFPGYSSLHWAAWQANKELVELLLANGAHVNATNGAGEAPLIKTFQGDGYARDIIRTLIDHGAKVPLTGIQARDLLHKAAAHGDAPVVELLLARGVQASVENKDGGSLLHSAAAGGLTRLLIKILALGVSVNAADRYGRTPLHMAAAMGRENAIGILLDRGAAIDRRTPDGSTALQLARADGHIGAADLLKRRGALQLPPRTTLRGAYLGQARPGDQPMLFGAGVVSTGQVGHGCPVFADDGRTVYWSAYVMKPRRREAILFMKDTGGRWSPPEELRVVSEDLEASNPVLSTDGRRLYFTVINVKRMRDIQIWWVERRGNGWSEATRVDLPMPPTLRYAGGFWIAANGTLYIDAFGPGGTVALYRSPLRQGKYVEPEEVLPGSDRASFTISPFVPPDERFLLFSSSRSQAMSDRNLFIAFRRPDGSWSNPVDVGPPLNSKDPERYASLTPDGKYVFFRSSRTGVSDVYWVAARVLERLRVRAPHGAPAAKPPALRRP